MVESWPSLSLWLLVSAGAGNVNNFHTWFLFNSSLEPVYFTWSPPALVTPSLPYLIFLQFVSISLLPSQLFLSLHIFFSLDNILFLNSYSFLKCLYIPSKCILVLSLLLCTVIITDSRICHLKNHQVKVFLFFQHWMPI